MPWRVSYGWSDTYAIFMLSYIYILLENAPLLCGVHKHEFSKFTCASQVHKPRDPLWYSDLYTLTSKFDFSPQHSTTHTRDTLYIYWFILDSSTHKHNASVPLTLSRSLSRSQHIAHMHAENSARVKKSTPRIARTRTRYTQFECAHVWVRRARLAFPYAKSTRFIRLRAGPPKRR